MSRRAHGRITYLEKNGLVTIVQHLEAIRGDEDLVRTLGVVGLLLVVDVRTTRTVRELCDTGRDIVVDMKGYCALSDGLVSESEVSALLFAWLTKQKVIVRVSVGTVEL